jgi:Fe-S cluster biogenesis protein NfuA
MDELNFVEGLVKQLRPFIQRDGGDMRFISYDTSTGVLTLELLGACIGCGSAEDHQDVVRNLLLEEVKFLKEVVFLD